MSEELTSSALLEQLVYIDNYINGTNPNTDSSSATPNVDVDGQLSLDLAAFADDSFIFPDEEKPKNLYGHDGDEDDEDKLGDRPASRANKDGGLAGSGNNNGLNGWNIHEFNSSSLLPTIKQEPETGSSSHHHHQYFGNRNFADGHEDDDSRLNQFNLLQNHINESGLGNELIGDLQNDSHKGHPNVPASTLDTQHHHVQPHKLLSLNELPKFPVPPGAKNSLVSAGLSSNQIDLLSALIAQHQTNLGKTIAQKQQQHVDESNGDGLGIQTVNNFQVKQQEPQLSTSKLPSNIAPLTPNGASSSPTDVQTRQSNPPFHLPSQPYPPTSLAQLNSSLQLQTRSRDASVSSTSLIDPSLQQQQQQNQHRGSAVGAGVGSLLTTGAPASTPASSNMSSPDAAELDKKRRNTAASARFRIKRKMKEQQMENKINSLQDMISSLENKLSHLEMENKLLRNLIIEKGSQKSEDELKLLKEKAKRG